MPFYSYKGRNAKGDLVQGVLEGTSSTALASHLLGLGVTPTDISLAASAGQGGTASSGSLSSLFQEKIGTIDLMMFSRQMYTLLKAGIPIMQSLGGLQASTQNKTMSAVIGDLRQSLDSGRELSAAMSLHPKVFSPFYLSMVRVGETTGMLENVFMRMFEHLEFEKFMRDQVKSALRYPSFVVLAMAVALVVINLFVIPAFSKVFSGLGAELPLLTRMLIGFSEFMVHSWPYLLAGLVAAAFLFRSWIATPTGKYVWDRFKLQLPIAGRIVQKATLARFSRSFAMSVRSGVPIVQGLALIGQTVDNDYLTRKIDDMRIGVEHGESILRTAVKTGVFTPIVLQMISVGEETGALDDLMQEIAEMYQRDVEYDLKTLGAQIEPILIVFLGVMVLILALGIFLPIWDLGSVMIKR